MVMLQICGVDRKKTGDKRRKKWEKIFAELKKCPGVS